jgi:hypothetical protein
MKTLFFFCGTMLIAITSCRKTSLNTSPHPALEKRPITSAAMQKISSSGALVFTSHTDIDLATPGATQVNFCTGETLQIVSGTLQIDFHQTVNNNTLTLDQHTNIKDYKLVGTSSGVAYTGSSSSTGKNHVSLNNGVFIITETESVLLTAPGGKNNPRIKFDLHLTFTPQGTLTAFVDNFSTSCQ